MTMNRNNFIITFSVIIVGLLVVTAYPVWGQGKDTAPGQTKKTQTTQDTTQDTSQKDKVSPGKEKKQEVIFGSVDDVQGNISQIQENKGVKKCTKITERNGFRWPGTSLT